MCHCPTVPFPGGGTVGQLERRRKPPFRVALPAPAVPQANSANLPNIPPARASANLQRLPFPPSRPSPRRNRDTCDRSLDMTLHPQAQVHAAWAATSDAVATQMAQAARQSGGSLLATAADLHKLGTGEAWPRSALELHHITLPALARSPDTAGCTVQRLADGRWHVLAAAVPVALPAAVAPFVALPAGAPLPAAAVKPVPTPTPPTPRPCTRYLPAR